jgi:hypothetical protein
VFFLLSKTLGTMLLPVNFLIGAGVLGAILLTTRYAVLGSAFGAVWIFAGRKAVDPAA